MSSTSTLEYLDDQGTVTSFTLVPWKTLHVWLSILNGNIYCDGTLAKGANRGKILEELEERRNGNDSLLLGGAMNMLGRTRGYGRDWREYENEHGYTHLEELLIFQPKDWRKQAREYLFRYKCDLHRSCTSSSEEKRTTIVEGKDIVMKNPISVVLFHPDIKRTQRYQPLNFLLSYGVRDPLPGITRSMGADEISSLMEYLSPLDYFFEFQNYVTSYDLDKLRKLGRENKCPRLCLIKELDFSDIIGQQLAKQMIRRAVVTYVTNRRTSKTSFCSSNSQPLSMIFAGPSGNGKTEQARALSKILNKPSAHDDYFHKVDCGKLSDDKEIFGMSGAYQGASQGSALNNFVHRLSTEPDAIGIVLLDEIEKATRESIHALYQVLDKGEWTNKRLGRGIQTETIPCCNIIFIMTTNACDKDIQDFAKTRKEEVYGEVGNGFDEVGWELEGRIRNELLYTYPFTEAFIGRVGYIVPFLPLGNGDTDLEHLLSCETTVVAKILIEREQEKYAESGATEVRQLVSPATKHQMAKIIVRDAISETGVRSIEKQVQARMGDKILHSSLLEEGGIQQGSEVEYFAREEERTIDFRARVNRGSSEAERSEDSDLDFEDVYE